MRREVHTPVDMTEHAVLGIDIGGSSVSLRREGSSATPVETLFRWAPSCNALDDIAVLRAAIRRMCHGVRAVGVAVPATLDARGVVCAWPNRPSWVGVDLASLMREAMPPARWSFADDGDLAALAESRAAGCASLVYVGLGTGVGGGAVLDGSLLGRRGAMEIGHTIIAPEGPACTCGRLGCLQAIASGPAIEA